MSENIDLPDDWQDWPFEARAYVLAEANTAEDLRKEINGIVGMSNDFETNKALNLKKDEAAQILMALGGPDGLEGSDD